MGRSGAAGSPARVRGVEQALDWIAYVRVLTIATEHGEGKLLPNNQ